VREPVSAFPDQRSALASGGSLHLSGWSAPGLFHPVVPPGHFERFLLSPPFTSFRDAMPGTLDKGILTAELLSNLRQNIKDDIDAQFDRFIQSDPEK
jgi:hypothetical protein